MNHFYFVSCSTDGIQFFTEEDSIFCTASEKDRQVEIFEAVADGICHGQERSDS